MQTKWLPLVVLSLILTSVCGYWLGKNFRSGAKSDLFSQKLLTPIETTEAITVEAAQLQRKEHYQSLNSIAEVLSLPSIFAQQEALHAIAGRANRVHLQQLLKEATGVVNTQQREGILKILMARFTEIDPQTAANIAMDAYENKNPSLLPQVYQHWAKLDLETAIKSANDIKNTYQKNTASQGVITAINVNDIQLITEVSKRLGIESSKEQYVSNALIEKASQDPEAAIQEAMRMITGYERDSALQGIVDTWTTQNPQQAFSYVERIADNRIRQQLLETVLYRWAETDPQEAYDKLQTLPNAGRTSGISYTVFTYLANENPRDALNIIENIPSSRSRVDAYNATIQTWAASDAQAAANFVAQLDNKQLKQQLAPTVIQYLSTQSPDEALTWAREQDPTGQLYLQNTVVSQIASENPERALQIALSSQQPTLRKQLIVTVVDNLSYNDPQRAAEMIDQLPYADVNAETINSVVYNWANSDPDAAMAWVNSKSGQVQENGLISIGNQLASVDPDLAASYLPQLSGPVRDSWAQNITYYYSSYDLNEAATWVENFRGEAIFESLLSSVVGVATSSDVEYALELAHSMPTQTQRNALIRQIADQISYNDPLRAEELYARLPKQEADLPQ
ncbi:MAG: hypothetical protein GKR92_09000 [Gammaproteobacteria bacterium]|nr:MAG: hypothetical protein GKR92_09000 [Gammaproteobacteria bacterium]